MQMMNYDLAKERIAVIKALRNPQALPHETWPMVLLLESLTGWWQSLTTPRRKVSAAYRAELMRQEWLVESSPVQEPKA
ncbi:MAG: hypothetical protein JWP00_327 [Chloroflexi bacterium]|jgi:hypothetical protein|nr:hypothetical protein [Chloroflexota bacterium]